MLNLTKIEAKVLSKVLTRIANGEIDVDEQTEKVCMNIVSRLNTEII